MSHILNPNQIKIRSIQGHTAFANYKQILPEHVIQQRSQPKLPALQCFTNTNCDCPTHARCVPLAAKRIGLLFANHQLKYTRQIIIPFKRNEDPLSRRIPPKRFKPFAEHDTPSLESIGMHGQPSHAQAFPDPPKSPKSPNPPKSAAETPWVTPQEKNLLLKVDPADGEVVGGERLSARETLRRLAYQGESESLGSEKVDRIWCLWVPRGFERMAIPFRVFRVNRDGLAWVLRQSEIVYIDPHPDFFIGMVMRPAEAPEAPGDSGLIK